ncbi:pyrroline-5-carboxylate reductase [Shewanella sp. 202IG2-18]|uniref:pyrroline-5-carboxylate reductase n=1 Tax=Parashewanella hymeniacidonis TaxID=2807618 RepID=UPI00196225F6|nr:pyrroline-5-carboxylate reductase [Parashewanella hymeniacidonis]MBM7072144.1 pyrroline-5-carboxylate reductase [Parashewanella hymeniacidonis]
MKKSKICFIGSGNMTRSIVSGLVKSGYPTKLIETTNPSVEKLNAMQADFGVNVSHDNVAACYSANIIVLSVKPQMMETVCNKLSHLDLSEKLIITIAAGIPANRYQDYFKQPVKVVRTMPNTPTQIGIGVTGIFADESISESEKLECEQIMQTGGEVVWVNKESELNQVIALAGSSPAYFFMFVESMLDAAEKMNVPADKARLMVQQAALGAAEMVKQNPDLTAAQLRENVTSKGGTTAQAIKTFEEGGLRQLVDSAMQNCVKRAEEMEKLF